MFANLVFMKMGAPDWSVDNLESGLGEKPFSPCEKLQLESRGFFAPAGDDDFTKVINGYAYGAYAVEAKKIQAAALNNKLAQECEVYMQRHGEYPDKKERKNIKERLILEMLPQVFPVRQDQSFLVAASGDFVVLSATSDTVVKKMREALAEASLPTITRLTPMVTVKDVMTKWVTRGALPEGLTLTGHLALKGEHDDSAITCNNVDPQGEDILQLIGEGRKVTVLGLYLEGFGSFKLDEKLTVKSIRLDSELVPELPAEAGEMSQAALNSYLIETGLSLNSPGYQRLYDLITSLFVKAD